MTDNRTPRTTESREQVARKSMASTGVITGANYAGRL